MHLVGQKRVVGREGKARHCSHRRHVAIVANGAIDATDDQRRLYGDEHDRPRELYFRPTPVGTRVYKLHVCGCVGGGSKPSVSNRRPARARA